MKIFIGFKMNLSKSLDAVKAAIPFSQVKKMKWVKESNIHLTFFFIGHVEKDKLLPISNELSKIATQNKPFSITVTGCDKFEKRHKNSILWLKVSPNEQLNQLQRQIESSFRFILENQSIHHDVYTPHITIARYNKNIKLPEIQNIRTPKNTISINEIQLIESQSTTNGVEYIILDNFKLKEE